MERMFALELRFEETRLLRQVLSQYVSDLRMEVANTENYDMRESMKRDEETLKAIITRLEDVEDNPAGA